MKKADAIKAKEHLLKRLAEIELEINKDDSLIEQIDGWTPIFRVTLDFATKEEKELMGPALETFVELRRMEGSEKPNHETIQFYVSIDKGKVIAEPIGELGSKVNYASPMFNTYASATKAIDTIGADRIRNMFNVLHGVTE